MLRHVKNDLVEHWLTPPGPGRMKHEAHCSSARSKILTLLLRMLMESDGKACPEGATDCTPSSTTCLFVNNSAYKSWRRI
mmetsp:Transcript_13477/g.46904  ORF Transcript_13477/g.46904 Transcript_13477/m.46904 type:complete len:80 (+) Transcript_13477:1088-1327(+)